MPRHRLLRLTRKSLQRQPCDDLAMIYQIIGIDEIHRLEKLVAIYKRTYDNQAADNAPKPEVFRTERVVAISGIQLVPDAIAYAVAPHQRSYVESKPGEDKCNQEEMHSVLSIARRGYDVDFFRNVGHYNQAVDPECDKVEKNVLQQPPCSAKHIFVFVIKAQS